MIKTRIYFFSGAGHSFAVARDNCFGCMGCFHWCPENAVKDVGLDMIQSPHREVTVGEMLKYAARGEK